MLNISLNKVLFESNANDKTTTHVTGNRIEYITSLKFFY